jgi:uncharacterized protein (DUF1778 family)
MDRHECLSYLYIDAYGIMPYNKIGIDNHVMSQTVQIPAKRARLEARITDKQKALFQHAADLTGRSLTEFIISSAQEVASRTVRENEVLTLRGRDRQVFINALLKPISPNKRLRQAARRYKKISGI